MSLILCRREPAAHPLYIEKLGVHIYSAQELCYVICQYPLLAMDGFVDDRLREFVADGLQMGFLAMKMEKTARGGGSDEEILMMILQECGYCSAAEIGKYKQQLAGYRKMRREEYEKATADFYYSLGQYRAAIDKYQEILDRGRLNLMDDEFAARLWSNIGASYAGMFWFERAMHAYEMSYGLSKSEDTVKRMYQLTLFAPKLAVKERYQSLITADMAAKWAAEVEEFKESACGTDEVQEVVLMFQKDPLKRAAACERKLGGWKKAYRAMV